MTRRKTYKAELEIHKKIISSIGSGFYKISLYRSNTITDKQDILDNANDYLQRHAHADEILYSSSVKQSVFSKTGKAV